MAKEASSSETHSFFPSGEWEGFYNYTYNHAGEKHSMQFSLNFSKGKISGIGSDDVGSFSWSGTYDIKSMTCLMTKQYHGRHQVMYRGNADENGIWGQWSMSDYFKGGFHIWPKKGGEANAEEEVAVKKKELKLTH